MYSKEKFSIAIFLSRVLMYQKRQISLPLGYKTARPQTGHWEWLWRHSRTSSFLFWANQFAKKWCNSALFIIKQENVGEICFSRSLKSWNDVTIVPSVLFWSRGFVPHWKLNLTLLVHQNTGKENRYRKIILLCLSLHWGDLIEQIKKEICYIQFKSIERFISTI